jgi:hypothetical protein
MTQGQQADLQTSHHQQQQPVETLLARHFSA